MIELHKKYVLLNINSSPDELPCYVFIEYENDYCYLIKYADSKQCNMIVKSDKRYSFGEV